MAMSKILVIKQIVAISVLAIFVLILLLLKSDTVKNARLLGNDYYQIYDVIGISSIYEHKGLSTTVDAFYGISKSNSWFFSLDSSSYEIDWSNIVFIMCIYESLETNKLLKAHFDTWLRHVKEGADIVFIADVNDARSIEEILPDANKIKATCHIYKSSAKDDGKRLRFKVLDAFRYVAEKQFNFTKKYFFKIDTDTFIVPDYILAYVDKLHEKTYPKPVQFGWANGCGLFCYADGGFYGFNDIGFAALNQYLIEHPDIDKIIESPHFSKYDRRWRYESFKQGMLHEDFMVSYLYREATQMPMVHNPLFRTHIVGISSRNGMMYHRVKNPLHFYEYENRFYSWEGKLKRGIWT